MHYTGAPRGVLRGIIVNKRGLTLEKYIVRLYGSTGEWRRHLAVGPMVMLNSKNRPYFSQTPKHDMTRVHVLRLVCALGNNTLV